MLLSHVYYGENINLAHFTKPSVMGMFAVPFQPIIWTFIPIRRLLVMLNVLGGGENVHESPVQA